MSMKLIDLSVVINEHTPPFPGDPETEIKSVSEIKKDGFEVNQLSLATHAGTHVDAPCHMIKGGKTLDQISLEKFIGRGILIKINESYSINELEKTDIRKDDIVLFQTGMSNLYGKQEYFEKYPAMSVEVAQYLVNKGVKVVGFDATGPDYDPFPAHKVLLKNEVLIIENLTNFEVLEGKEFTVYAFPIKLQVDGAPSRVIAKIK